jgi:hypothetical protein
LRDVLVTKRVRILASPEAETFLWRRNIKRRTGIPFSQTRPRTRAQTALERLAFSFFKPEAESRREPLRHNICQAVAQTKQQPGNASAPTKTNRTLLCWVQTVSPKRETIRILAQPVKLTAFNFAGFPLSSPTLPFQFPKLSGISFAYYIALPSFVFDLQSAGGGCISPDAGKRADYLSKSLNYDRTD